MTAPEPKLPVTLDVAIDRDLATVSDDARAELLAALAISAARNKAREPT